MNLASRSIPAASPQDPVERFRGSHLAILEGLAELRRLPMFLEALKQARLTAEATLALFERQVLPHHLDEEQKLFTAALAQAASGAERQGVEELLARLVAQHRHVEQLWSQLRPSLVAIAAGQAPASPTFREDVVNLVEACLDHTRLEERAFLPLAQEILARQPGGHPPLDPAQHVRGVGGPAAPANEAEAAAMLEQLVNLEHGPSSDAIPREPRGPG